MSCKAGCLFGKVVDLGGLCALHGNIRTWREGKEKGRLWGGTLFHCNFNLGLYV